MAWLPDCQKKFEDVFIRFDRMYERDRHTDRHTPHDGIGHTCSASRGKNYLISDIFTAPHGLDFRTVETFSGELLLCSCH